MEAFFSPAKINLRLKVLGRRADGYHLLSMLNGMLTLGDDLYLELTDTPGVAIETVGRFPEELIEPLHDPTVNLAARAATLVLERAGLSCGVNIQLNKCVPTGGGLGGGSSNAACVLLNLPDLLQEAGVLSAARRQKLFRQLPDESVALGADVPFFMRAQDTISHVTGIGEIVQPVRVENLYGISVFIVMPRFNIATPAVFSALRDKNFDEAVCSSRELAQLGALDGTHSYEWLVSRIENDLLEPAQTVQPEMQTLYSLGMEVPDIVFMQSGSGSSFFAVPKSIDFDELAIEQALKKKFSDMDVEIIKTNLLAKPDY